MKVIQTTVYNFDELNAAAKEKARQWYREGNEFFSDGVIDDAVSIAERMGIEIDSGKDKSPRILFSGFSSQGDGACFEGTWRASNVQRGKVKEYAPKDEQLHRIAAEFERTAKAFPNASFTVKHSGHYYHEMSTNFDFRFIDAQDNEINTPEAMQAQDDLTVNARMFMRWIYRQLEAEYEYQNADEQVDETIIANCYTFTANGKRFGN